MCLAIPVEVREVLSDDMAKVSLDGVVKVISTALIDDVKAGDYVVLHVGYALAKIDPEEAQKTIELLNAVGAVVRTSSSSAITSSHQPRSRTFWRAPTYVNSARCRIDGFVGPAHVSTVIGTRPYDFFAEEFQKPVVVAGFEPLDVMQAILMLVRQVNEGRAEVENQYVRAVTADGNLKAQNCVAQVFELRDSFEWRGLGPVPYSALQPRTRYARFDAERVFEVVTVPAEDNPACECGAILRSKIRCELEGAVAYLHFPFYSGAMATADCRALTEAIAEARRDGPRDLPVGGPDYWSNGLHLGRIETLPARPTNPGQHQRHERLREGVDRGRRSHCRGGDARQRGCRRRVLPSPPMKCGCARGSFSTPITRIWAISTGPNIDLSIAAARRRGSGTFFGRGAAPDGAPPIATPNSARNTRKTVRLAPNQGGDRTPHDRIGEDVQHQRWLSSPICRQGDRS